MKLSILENFWPDPSQTTDPVVQESYQTLATNKRWKHPVLRFGYNNAAQPSVRTGIFGLFPILDDYTGSPLLRINWTATLTSGNVVWDFEYRSVGGDDAESLDQTGEQESLSVTDAAPTAANRRLSATIALTAGNFAPGNTVEYFLARDGNDASDTMAGAAILHEALFEYS